MYILCKDDILDECVGGELGTCRCVRHVALSPPMYCIRERRAERD